ncbi:MAG: hypothetical protein DMD59_08175 [Gemmatimonadetes bacterium]|nr:MAG: hypothetical protein DMD59_08175 [Gemmatimonadota bacterium]
MQRTFAMLVLIASAATTARAQSWHSEFGIQSGYSRIKAAGTNAPDHIDLFGVPGFNLPGVLPGGASLFAILPWKNKIAFETSVSALQGNALGILGDATFFNLGVRGDYAITPKVYAAAGGAVNWVETGGQHETQLGLVAAAGYRFGFVRGLRGRVEASARFYGKSNLLSPVDVYALEFGVSKQLGAGARTSAPARASTRAWQPMLGVQGGYTRSHSVGGGADLTAVSVPGLGGAVTVLGTPAGPPILFAILPIGRKIAVEPGLDISRIQTSGTTSFGGNTSARLDYAVSGGWYAAAGGNLVYIKTTGSSSETVTGMNLAWGYRFPFSSGLGGRFEIDYTMMRKNDNLFLPPTNTLGLQFGATMPLR